MHSGYEECRADTVAAYLMHYNEPFDIFFSDKKEDWDDIYYTGWLEIFTKAIKGFPFYDIEQNEWT